MRTKLISAFLIVVLVPLMGTGLYGNWITSKTLTDQALEATQHDLEQRALRVNAYLTGITSNTLYLSSFPPLQALMEARSDSDADQVDLRRQQTGEEFLRFAAAHSSIVQIRYIAENGQELVRVNSGAAGVAVIPSSQLQNKSQRYYFTRTMELQPEQVFVSALDLNKELGVVEVPYQPVMRYATPLFLSDGDPAGILVINIDAQGVLDAAQGEAGEKGVLALVDKQGYYVVHSDASKSWGGPSNLAHGSSLGADYPELEDVLLSGGRGVILLNEGLEPSGTPWGRAFAWAERQVLGPKRVLVYHTVLPTEVSSDNMWVLLRDEPPASIFASVWSFRLTGASILIGAILAALLMAVALARRLTAPIIALTQGVRRLAEGQLEGPIEVMGHDEMGELATAFNEMVAALQGNLERLTLLHQGGQDIASQLGWDEVLRAMTRAVTSLVGGDYCIISFREGSAEKDVIAISEGDDTWLSHRSATEVVATLQASLDGNTWQALSLPPGNGPAGYLCCAPMIMGETRRGIVEVYGHQEVLADPATGSLLAALASQGSITLEKADLIQQLGDHKGRLEALVERLIGAQEEERRVVAYDIHDGLIQMLVGVRLHLTNYAAQLGAVPPEAQIDLRKGLDQLGAVIAEARRVIEGLRPTTLDELGLAITLQQYAQDLARDEEWDLEFNADPADLRASPAVETTAFRIAQEALTNARKYAHTDRLQVTLTNQDGELAVQVRDWGQGFDQDSVLAHRRSVGLAGMRERARLLGGLCTIDSKLGQGTTVRVTLPLRTEENGSG